MKYCNKKFQNKSLNKVIVSITLFMLMGIFSSCTSVKVNNVVEEVNVSEIDSIVNKEINNEQDLFEIESENYGANSSYSEEEIVYEYVDKIENEVVGNNSNDNINKSEKKNDELSIENSNIATRSKIDKLYFAGDVYFSKNVKDAYAINGLNGIIDKNYLAILKDGDINMANLECAITDSTASEANKQYTLYTPEKYISVIKEVGFNIMTLANNHVLDFGNDALLNTMSILKNNAIEHVGVGKDIDEASTPLIKEIDGKKYAIFAASAVLPNDMWKAGENHIGINNGYDIATICKSIKDIKQDVDKVIVYMHWGEELSYKANEKQKNYAHKLVDFGADLVVGSHPHVVQEIEYYKNVPIVYSLGNFIYGATKKDTILLEAGFNYSEDVNGILQLRIYPGLSNYEQVKYYWEKETLKEKCKEFQDKCDTCYIGDNGYVFTVEQVEEASKKLASSSEIN